jgi:hypothetical protein
MVMKKKMEDWMGLFIPGGLFIGMGLGFLYNQLVAGLFIGLGMGFALAATAHLVMKK